MADWNTPALSTTYDNFLLYLKNRDVDSAVWLDTAVTTPSSVQTGFKRWNSTNSRFEKYDGAAWVKLSPGYALDLGSGSTINATPVGATTPSTGNFTAFNTTGNATLGGTLGVTGAATLSSTLSVAGVATFSAALNANAGITSTTLTTTNWLSVGTNLGVTGNTTLSGVLSVAGASTFTGLVTANGGLSTTTLTASAITATTSVTGITEAKWTNSTRLASTAFVQNALGNMQGVQVYTTTASVPASASGSLLVYSSAATANGTLTLPAPTPAGASYCVLNNSNYTLTVTTPSGTFYGHGAGHFSGVATNTLTKNQGLYLVADGSNWTVIDSSFVYSPSKYDKSNLIANTAWVQQLGPMYSANMTVSAATTLVANDVGKIVYVAAGATVTAPKANSVPDGAILTIYNADASLATIAFQSPDTNASISMSSGDWVILVSVGSANRWHTMEINRGMKYGDTVYRAHATVNTIGGGVFLQNSKTHTNPGNYMLVRNVETGVLQIYDSTTAKGAYLNLSECGANIGSKLWHSGNHGPGSGLNADLLDGLHATAFVTANTELPNAANLDNYKTTGVYFQTTNAGAAAGTSFPTPYAGLLRVFSYSEITYQYYQAYNADSRVFYRSYYSPNATWTPWREVISGDGTQTLSGLKTFTQPITANASATKTLAGIQASATAQTFDEQVTVKAPFYSEITTAASQDIFVPSIKHKQVIGSTATAVFTMGMYQSTDNTLTGTLLYRTSAGPHRQWAFSPDGSFTSPGNITAFSDKRFKKDITKIECPLEKTMALQGVTFKNIDDDTGRTNIGLIAQDVFEIVPEAVHTIPGTDKLSVAYGNLVGLLIEAVKELKAEVDVLKGRIIDNTI